VIDASLERVGATAAEGAQPRPPEATPAAKVAAAVEDALKEMPTAAVTEEGAAVDARSRAGVALETIIGEQNFLDIRYLEAGVAAARAVCRIEVRDARGRVAGYGTGSLVSPRLLLTNHHVFPDAQVARRSDTEFNYQDGLDGQPLRVVKFALDPDAFFVADAERDFALVAVAAAERALSPFGLNPLIEAEGKAVVGEFVTIVQHPGGRKKQIALRENQIVDFLESFLHYQADTEPGSSGSPVFNDQWEIVALHHASVAQQEHPEYGKYLNEGIRASRILKHVRAQHLPPAQRELADRLTRPQRIALPTAVRPATSVTEATETPAGGTVTAGATEGEVKVTVPLEISVRLGAPSSAPPDAGAVGPPGASGPTAVFAPPLPASEPGLPVASRLRLLVDAQVDGHEAKLAVTRAAEAVFGARPERARVAYLFGSDVAGDAELGRFFEVVVPAAVDGRSAWDYAYALQKELPQGSTVEPDLPSSLGTPDPDQAVELEVVEAADAFHWALELVRAPQAWAVQPAPGGSSTGSGIVVGHPDTGYVIHEELEPQALDLTRDRDVVSGDDDATDPLESGRFPEFLQPGHGTRTASVIVGRRTGVLAGVAPEATLVPIRTVRSVVQVLDGDVAKAVNYARTSGCHVISMSLGGLGFSGLEQAINRVVREGLIVLAAAGNFIPFHIVCWPARYRNCIAVAAVNSREKPWKDSSRGGKIAVSAPGESVWVPDLSRTRTIRRSSPRAARRSP